MFSHLSSSQFKRADRLFDELIELSREQRLDRLREITRREPELANLLRRLLATESLDSALDQRSRIVKRWMTDVQDKPKS